MCPVLSEILQKWKELKLVIKVFLVYERGDRKNKSFEWKIMMWVELYFLPQTD